jgi:hypothetical protein
MKKRFVIALAVVGLAGLPAGIATGASAAPAPATAHAAKTCSSGYTHAVIGGAEKCLRRGEYCAVAYKSQYRRYGFTCSGNPARLH